MEQMADYLRTRYRLPGFFSLPQLRLIMRSMNDALRLTGGMFQAIGIGGAFEMPVTLGIVTDENAGSADVRREWLYENDKDVVSLVLDSANAMIIFKLT